MSQPLAAARTAARAGDVATVDRLLLQLEDRLTEDQVRVLRRQIYGDLQAAVGGGPLGRAQPTEAQNRLLAQTSAVDDGVRLSRQELNAELDVVQRSRPRPSTEPGYLDEVDLGNGHTWRRRDDGRWCRFSTRSLCGTPIPGAPAVSAEVQARIASLRGRLEMLRADIITARELAEEYPQVVARLRANTAPGLRTINFAALTEREQQVLAQVFPHLDEAQLARLTWPQIEAQSRVLARNLEAGFQAEERLLGQLHDEGQPLYERLRTRSPRGRGADQVLRRARREAGVVDEVSLTAPPSGSVDIDHVYPLRRTMDLPGFDRLQFAEQVALLNDPQVLLAVDSSLNRSRGQRLWTEDWPRRAEYSGQALMRAEAAETRVLAYLRERIDTLLRARGLVPVP
jgi:hypothetical protein